MRLLKKIFGWNSDKNPVIEQQPIAPQFTSDEDEAPLGGEQDIIEEEPVEETPAKTEVKLGRKTYIVEDLTAADIKKLSQEWGKRKLKAVGIIK